MDMAQWIAYHQNFLEEGKFIDGGASVVCVVSHTAVQLDIYCFWHHVGIL